MAQKIALQPTLPTFGEIVPNAGGRLAGIMRGNMVDGKRQPDYAIILCPAPAALLPWGKYDQDVSGATSLTDGLANTLAMVAAKCPAALHVHQLREGGYTDWYLPARAEMWAIRANVPELFEKTLHWTSTQDSRFFAFIQGFETGYSDWYYKDYERRVVACRRIQLQHFNP